MQIGQGLWPAKSMLTTIYSNHILISFHYRNVIIIHHSSTLRGKFRGKLKRFSYVGGACRENLAVHIDTLDTPQG